MTYSEHGMFLYQFIHSDFRIMMNMNGIKAELSIYLTRKIVRILKILREIAQIKKKLFLGDERWKLLQKSLTILSLKEILLQKNVRYVLSKINEAMRAVGWTKAKQ